MGSLGFEEMIVIAVVAIILYGRDLPSVARKVGRWYSNLRRQLGDIKDELKRHIPDEEIEEIKSAADPAKAFTEAASAGPDPDPTPPAPPPAEAPSPSAALPGPDPSDPEYRPDAAKAFDPTRPPEPQPPPPGNGNGAEPPGGAGAPPESDAVEPAKKETPAA
jgi:sec-independent protein translocase protein TatA